MSSGYAKAGVEMSGSPLLALEHARAGMESEITEMKRDAQWRAYALRAGAKISMDQASDRRTAGWIQGAGMAVQGYAKYASASSSSRVEPTSTTGLPASYNAKGTAIA